MLRLFGDEGRDGRLPLASFYPVFRLLPGAWSRRLGPHPLSPRHFPLPLPSSYNPPSPKALAPAPLALPSLSDWRARDQPVTAWGGEGVGWALDPGCWGRLGYVMLSTRTSYEYSYENSVTRPAAMISESTRQPMAVPYSFGCSSPDG
jgi:hypothetical protein